MKVQNILANKKKIHKKEIWDFNKMQQVAQRIAAASFTLASALIRAWG